MAYLKESKTQSNILVHYIPILGWLPKYDRTWLNADLLAGVVAAAVVIPQSMAYASIAGHASGCTG